MRCLAPFVALALTTGAVAQEKHPFTVDDLLAMQRISDPQASPDGSLVAFVVRTTDFEENKGRMDVWCVPTAGGEARPLTTHEANDMQPRFAPDGKSLFFLSARSGSMQVWRLPIDGGESEQVTKLPLDVDNLLVFPDGERLLLSIEVYPDAKDLAETAARDEAKAKSKVKARTYDLLPFRHWDQWEDGKRSHWFVARIDGAGDPIDLMKGIDRDSPTKPFGGVEQATIHPDGNSVVFVAKNAGRDSMWSTNLDLYRVPADGSKPAENITAENPALDDQPTFSPDGSRLAYLAMKRPMYESDRQAIMLLDLKTMQRREVAAAWDRSAASLSWNGDGLNVTADHIGNTGLFVIDVERDVVGPRVEKGSVSSPVMARGPNGSRLAFLYNDLDQPDEIEFIDASAPRGALTSLNKDRLSRIAFGSWEQFSFKGAHGDPVYGFVTKPASFDAAKKYPVAFLIHGGPQGSFSDRFHYRWNPQVYAGAGYASVFIDFHGSTGYGQTFTDSIRGDWGGAPYEDLMKGLDAALAKYEFLDGSRVAALGASYGGYMINWIAGQTDRFRCLVNHDGNLDERIAYFDTEELWFPEWEHGTPWENPESYAKHNPIDHVAKWKTPMLVIHGGNDFRVVDTQGMSTFTALQRRGIPSKFLHFPDENHWVLKPQNSKLWHETVLAWLDRWTKSS